ncbi:hypothetical protein GUJ93_ZPchr0005g15107 [Zizania palustris]|uniref:Uncharacterized protein n=1 Tax=Zizania palustris TaxID=103762 RepID=A0A8J5W1V9_ZIZPA|nr:hypothetical protein GUJ93_ZPchr0005g15107 [Zizania palustris]
MCFDEVIRFSSVPTALRRDESPLGPDITDTGGGAAHSRPRANSATFAMSSLFLMLWMATVSSPFKVGEPGGRQHWWRAVATSGQDEGASG